MGGDEDQQAGQDDCAAGLGESAAVMAEGPCRHPEADDVSQRARQHQLSAADAVDQRKGRHGQNEVRPAHGHGLQKRRRCAGAGHLEDPRGVVHHGVDARKLVERGDGHRQHDRPAVPPLEQRFPQRAPLCSQRVPYLVDLAPYVSRVGAVPLEHGRRLLDPVTCHQPSGAPGNQEEQEEEGDGGDRLDAEHPAPVDRPEVHAGDVVVAEEGQEDPQDYVELGDRDEPAAVPGGGELGDVHGGDHRRAADAEPPDEPEGHKGDPVPGKGASHGGNEIELGHDEKRALPPESVGGTAGGNGARYRPYQRAGDREPEPERRQAEFGLQSVDRAGDDGGIESEEESAEGRDDRGAYQPGVHTFFHGGGCG